MKRSSSPAFAALLVSAGCGGGAAPNPWVELAPAVDQNPDPHIVEVSIEARQATKAYLPDTTTKVLTYNGTVPGPLVGCGGDGRFHRPDAVAASGRYRRPAFP